jgi:hypothetical protein
LRRLLGATQLDERERLDQRQRSELGEPQSQLAGGLVVGDGRARLDDRWSGVERLHHAHDRDPRLGVALANRLLYGSRAPEERQKRRVDVDRAARRQVDDRLRQDVPVRHDHGNVGSEVAQLRDEVVAARRSGWSTGTALGGRDALYGRRLENRARSSDGAVRLRDDADDVEPFAQSARSGSAKSGVPESTAHSQLPRRVLVVPRGVAFEFSDEPDTSPFPSPISPSPSAASGCPDSRRTASCRWSISCYRRRAR